MGDQSIERPKRSHSLGSVRKRKAITIGQKLDVIKRYERDEKTRDIMRATGFSESTLRTIRNNAMKIKESCSLRPDIGARKILRLRPRIIEETEHLLSIWIEDQMRKRRTASSYTVQEKAMLIYEELKDNAENPDDAPTFNPSGSWFMGFKNRYDLCNVKLCEEPVTADEEAFEKFHLFLLKLIEDGGYTHDQIFNIDETVLYWKRMPSKTSISRKEALSSGFKPSKDRLTVMLGANASGDYKLKPLVVYHVANPSALNGLAKSELGVNYQSSKKGWVTEKIFSDHVVEVLEDVLRKYCKEKNLTFKILLVMDSAPSRPPTVAELSKHIKVLFLPPNAASFLQPLDQGIITMFKTCYSKHMFSKLVEATTGTGKPTVEELWKNFSIKHALEIIVNAWDDITEECLNYAWCKLLPFAVTDFNDFDVSRELTKIKQQCTALAGQIGFDEVTEKDIEQLLESHMEELSIEDLQQLASEVVAACEDSNDHVDVIPPPPRELTTILLTSALQGIERHLKKLEDNDSDIERSKKVIDGMNDLLAPYYELLNEKRKLTPQPKVDVSVEPQTSDSMDETEILPSVSDITFLLGKSQASPVSPILSENSDKSSVVELSQPNSQ